MPSTGFGAAFCAAMAPKTLRRDRPAGLSPVYCVRCALIIKKHKRHQTQLRQRRFRQHRLATFRVNSGQPLADNGQRTTALRTTAFDGSGQPLSDNGQRTTALRTTAFDGSGQPLSRHGGRAADNRFAQRTTAFAHLCTYTHICTHMFAYTGACTSV